MKNIFDIFLLFLIPANIILLFLFYFKFEKYLGKYFSIILAYGVAPLLNSLIFYYLIWFFPGSSNAFYLFIVFAFWIMLFLFSYKNIDFLKRLYLETYKDLKKRFSKKRIIIVAVLLFFIGIFSYQALFFPITDNDSSLYLMQSKALYQYKNLAWEKGEVVLVDGLNEYKYDSAIRPAIPSFMALNFSLNGNDSNQFVLQFVSFYYYYLLFAMFLFLVYKLSKRTNKDAEKSLFYGALFFIFSWTLARSFIFNTKETVIYALALLSIYLAYKLISNNKRDIKLEILLGILLGLNSFVNMHGIIIMVILLFILFFLSKLTWMERIWQIISIFSIHLFFSAFEFFKLFSFIFGNTFKASFAKRGLNKEHLNLYQISNFKELYIKGKLQILDNIGVFGFYFWFFLVIIAFKIREIWESKLGKVIVSFVTVYFFMVLDPFNLNKNQYAIVLWGSTKYASLVLLTSMIVLSVYADPAVKQIIKFTKRFYGRVIVLFGIFILIALILKSYLISIGTSVLLSVIPVYKDISFYESKVEIFYLAMILCLSAFFLGVILLRRKEKIFENLFAISFLTIYILAPFLITNVGKVPLADTFIYINKSKEEKLKNILYHGDVYRIYYYAKKNLPFGTVIKSDFNEVYSYNDYFKLSKKHSGHVAYAISKKCINNKDIIFESGGVKLCRENN